MTSRPRPWDGTRFIYRYHSTDLWNWKLAQKIPTASDRSIDPSLCRMVNGAWRMWYKDEAHGSDTGALESRDLKAWQPVKDPGVSKLYGEGPRVFHYKGAYWLIKDPDSGLDVYRSPDLDKWTYQGKILDQPGRRNDDGTIGKHADVVVCGNRAFIIYFTHPDTQDFPEKKGILPDAARRSSLQGRLADEVMCPNETPPLRSAAQFPAGGGTGGAGWQTGLRPRQALPHQINLPKITQPLPNLCPTVCRNCS